MHRRSFLQGIAAGGLSLPVVGAAEVPSSPREGSFGGPETISKVNLVIDTSRTLGPIDLTRYALGQGGLSPQPMISDRVDQLRQLHPQTVNFFVQEYFDLYPAHHQYHWATLDKAIEPILEIGAKPIMNLTLKPPVLYPQINDEIVVPTSWAEWEELIYRLVRHCNQDRKFGIEYWLVENEGDIGEASGCPYKFTPQSYVTYYKHTASAIRRADPTAKVGGPAPARYTDYESPFVDALVDSAARGEVPFDFLCFHGYNNDPRWFWELIDHMKAKLDRHSQLSHVETMIDQWNISLGNPILDPYFQPAFILETTSGFYNKGLTRSSYYQIRDYFVDPKVFSSFMSKRGTAFMAHWWNTMPQYDALYDNQNRLRPAYYSFFLLNHIKGRQLPVTGAEHDIRVLAAAEDPWINVVLWNFPLEGRGSDRVVAVEFPSEKKGSIRLVRLNPESPMNNLQQIRNGALLDPENNPVNITLRPYEIYWIEITRP